MFESDEHPIIIKNGKTLDLFTLSTSQSERLTQKAQISSNFYEDYYENYHSAFAVDFRERVVFFNDKNALVLDVMNRKSLDEITGVNCTGIVCFGKDVNYAIC